MYKINTMQEKQYCSFSIVWHKYRDVSDIPQKLIWMHTLILIDTQINNHTYYDNMYDYDLNINKYLCMHPN